MARTRNRRSRRQIEVASDTIGPLLRDAGFVGSELDPAKVTASFDDEGRPRRIHARYEGGWTCTMHLSRDGSYSLTQSIRMRVAGRVKP